MRHATIFSWHFSLPRNAHEPGTPTPGRMGGFLFKPIYFNLIQIRIGRALHCLYLLFSLLFFGYFFSHSQPKSHREHLSVFMLTQFDYSYVEVCIHGCLELSLAFSLALSLALSLSSYLSRPRSLPPSLLFRFSPPTLSSCPQTPSLDFVRTRAYLCTYPYWYIYRHTECHKMRVGRVLETLNQGGD